MNTHFLGTKDKTSIFELEKWIYWIPFIKEMLKLNVDSSKIKDANISGGWVIRNLNETIKMTRNRYL